MKRKGLQLRVIVVARLLISTHVRCASFATPSFTAFANLGGSVPEDGAIVYSAKEEARCRPQGSAGREKYIGTLDLARLRSVPAEPSNRSLIVNIGMPKSGTTSIHSFFTCLGLHAYQHAFSTPTPPTTVGEHQHGFMLLSDCVRKSMERGLPALELCPLDGQVFIQIDHTPSHHNIRDFCFFPQIETLPYVFASYPKGTFVLNVRNSTKWVASLKHQGGLDKRIFDCCPNTRAFMGHGGKFTAPRVRCHELESHH